MGVTARLSRVGPLTPLLELHSFVFLFFSFFFSFLPFFPPFFQWRKCLGDPVQESGARRFGRGRRTEREGCRVGKEMGERTMEKRGGGRDRGGPEERAEEGGKREKGKPMDRRIGNAGKRGIERQPKVGEGEGGRERSTAW